MKTLLRGKGRLGLWVAERSALPRRADRNKVGSEGLLFRSAAFGLMPCGSAALCFERLRV
ncbi:hypothetical protein SBA2_30044 [Acidobacteriia bacterium SbA2]|nr:hypothetical protein SBA2_30044 [Acidobacteriia bacterium SbA2]